VECSEIQSQPFEGYIMSYEGYSQKLCRHGHYSIYDALTEMYCGVKKCPICGEKFVWENAVDETNGSFENGIRIDGFISLEIEKETNCKECGHNIETIYKIPKTKRRK
jgi:uncharacterized protein (UPF0212 family)